MLNIFPEYRLVVVFVALADNLTMVLDVRVALPEKFEDGFTTPVGIRPGFRLRKVVTFLNSFSTIADCPAPVML